MTETESQIAHLVEGEKALGTLRAALVLAEFGPDRDPRLVEEVQAQIRTYEEDNKLFWGVLLHNRENKVEL